MINLTALRAIQHRYLTDLAVISRYTETSTAAGVEQAWAPLGPPLACRVSPIGSGAVERPGAEGAAGGGVVRAVSEWTVWLPALTDVTERDRITVTGTDRIDDRVFEVNRVGQRTCETVRECVCSLVL